MHGTMMVVHRARLTIDLPSEPLPADPALLAVLRWIFTTGESQQAERVVGSGLSWCQRLLGASAEGGLADIVALLVDDRELYLDQAQRSEAFAEVLGRVLRRGTLDGGFDGLKVTLSVVESGWHALAAISLRPQVARGEPEIDVHWSARSLALRIGPDETPATYCARITALARDAEACNAAFAPPDALLDRALAAWSTGLAPASIAVSRRRRVVVVPGPIQCGRLRHLGFGPALRDRSYRAKAPETRTGAYDEPHVYYYFDPYHDLLSWILATEIAEQRWRGPEIDLVDHEGKPLPVGPGARERWKVGPHAVRIEGDALVVADSVPEIPGLDVAEVGSPDAPGFGGGEGG